MIMAVKKDGDNIGYIVSAVVEHKEEYDALNYEVSSKQYIIISCFYL